MHVVAATTKLAAKTDVALKETCVALGPAARGLKETRDSRVEMCRRRATHISKSLALAAELLSLNRCAAPAPTHHVSSGCATSP